MQKPRMLVIIFILPLIALLCGSTGAVSIGSEPHITSGASAPVCTAPCECMSETAATQRWGTDGWERCSKSICGQSEDAMVQYYCIHQSGSSAAAGAADQQVPAGGVPVTPTATGSQKSAAEPLTIIAALGCMVLACSHLRQGSPIFENKN